MTRSVRAACLLSLSIGLLFLLVRAPHPWGWNGFDHYHELALALASGTRGHRAKFLGGIT
jgi:hypothetical protein